VEWKIDPVLQVSLNRAELPYLWIKISWQWISPEVIVKGFKQCCTLNEMDGREDEEKVQNVGHKMGTVNTLKLR
jgi:hypothetical protein